MPTHKKPNTEEIWRFFFFFLFSTSGDGNSPKSRHFQKQIIFSFWRNFAARGGSVLTREGLRRRRRSVFWNMAADLPECDTRNAAR
jgi:hypothetical protein